MVKKMTTRQSRTRKAQITLFIVLGIVVVIAFSLIFFIKSRGTGLGEQQSDILASGTQLASLKYYVDSCLSKASQEALDMVSRGGFIHSVEGSLVDWDIPYLMFDNRSIAYQVYSPSAYLVSSPPYYPCYAHSSVPAWTGEQCFRSYDHTMDQYLFGSKGEPQKSVFPEMCKFSNLTGLDYDCRCIKCDGYSIQEQMEHYVLNRTQSCINFSYFSESLGYDISPGIMNVKVSFGHKDVLFRLIFPLRVEMEGKEAELREFTADEDVRLFHIFQDLVRPAVDAEINDVTYDIRNGILDMANEKEINGISVMKFVDPETLDSIIIINDSFSRFRGDVYQFSFAVRNRPPALDYFTKKEANPDPKNYDVYVAQDEPIILAPLAFDPDDDEIRYSYTGWLDAVWESSVLYANSGENCRNPVTGVIDKSRCASYVPTGSDIGPHEVTITVTDAAGNRDFQNVRIFVDDKPRLNVKGSNLYADINDNYASPEDPYLFNASNTADTYAKGALEFSWMDITQPFTIDWSTVEEQFIPWTINEVGGLRNYYTSYHGIDYNFFFSPVKNHTIIARARDTGAPSVIGEQRLNLEVMECLPHRSTSPSYPFNNLAFLSYSNQPNPYQANHTCCEDDFTLSDDSKLCFELVDYGCRIKDPVKNQGWANHDPLPDQNRPPPSGPENAVYKRTFTRECDGTRGNTCTGDVVEDFVLIEECADEPGQHPLCNRCTYGVDHCVNTSLSDNVECGSQLKCSSGPNGVYSNGGSYLCKGSCRGNGKCNYAYVCQPECANGCDWNPDPSVRDYCNT
ncbi:hypothetical protein JW968_05415 [Candidatus Woesearchaeota archaeon]|nr:hypothetical protein [Candidatus Woesearchaeota archaeon]